MRSRLGFDGTEANETFSRVVLLLLRLRRSSFLLLLLLLLLNRGVRFSSLKFQRLTRSSPRDASLARRAGGNGCTRGERKETGERTEKR